MLVLFILATLSAGCSALYPPESAVVNLTSDNFDSEVIQSDDIWIVQFYSPLNDGCKQLVPEYTKAAKNLTGLVKVGAINVDEYASLQIRFIVESVPTILIFSVNKEPEEFKGPLTDKRIIDAALEVKQKTRLKRKYYFPDNTTSKNATLKVMAIPVSGLSAGAAGAAETAQAGSVAKRTAAKEVVIPVLIWIVIKHLL